MGVNQSARRKHHITNDEEVGFFSFDILRAIGKGSFGKVCIVQKKDTKQMYAMKYMSKAACLEKDALRNVVREIEILTKLDHPFLVNLWFSFHDEEDMFLVQDLLLGGDLRYHLIQNGTFSPEAIKLYLAELALALDYLHNKRIIHRDIKPDNILLDEEGHAHLTDFNVATSLEDEKKLASTLSGTKPYMAPEVFECSLDLTEGYDQAVDWWSLGIVAYELRFGKRPYDIHSNSSAKDVLFIISKEPEYPVTWSPPFIQVLQQLLKKTPPERLQSLEDLKKLQLMHDFDFDDVLEKKIKPSFMPPKGHLNCDPTFELEEMIVESRPLHKKKKRLAKQRSLRELQTSSSEQELSLDPLVEEFIPFNRQREIDRLEREKKEQEWEKELLSAMEASGKETRSAAVLRSLRSSDSQVPGSSEPEAGSSLDFRSLSIHPKGRSEEKETEDDEEESSGKSSCNVSGSKPSRVSICKQAMDGRKTGWTKSRSMTVPEGSKLWKRSGK